MQLNSPSPQVSQNMVEVTNRKAPLTDRDRRVYSKNGQLEATPDLGPLSTKLDEKFLRNFGNPELFGGFVSKPQLKKENSKNSE